MAKQEKTFNTKLYALVVFLLVAAILAVSTVATFSSKYIAFKPEKVAQAYADTIVQTGDGYNANKYALVSKSEKYGDFIRKFYMYPVIYKDAGYKPGDDTKNLKGLNDDSYKSDKTKNDDGTLTGQVTAAMYPYYVYKRQSLLCGAAGSVRLGRCRRYVHQLLCQVPAGAGAGIR